MTDLSTLRLFATRPHPCSYLEGQEAITVFVDPEAEITLPIYTQLSQLGFRRSGTHLYRPQCMGCQACISCRLPVNRFQMSRSQKRAWKKNQDISTSQVCAIDTDEHYALYAKYISIRHKDGDMYPPSPEQYAAFLTTNWGFGYYLEFRLEGKLIGVAVCDELEDGLSAVYTFYDPDYEHRSLGVFSILSQIDRVKADQHSYLYLGYWIKNCQKMQYKIQYQPLELLVNQRWLELKL